MSGRHRWSDYNPGGFAAVPEAVWERMLEAMPRPLEPDLAVADLRVWVSRAVHPAADLSVWPSLKQLMERWDWTREKVRALLKAEHAWQDPTLTGERAAKWAKVRDAVFSRAPDRNPTGTPREPHGDDDKPHGDDEQTPDIGDTTPQGEAGTPREPHGNPNRRVDPPEHQNTGSDPPPTPSTGVEGDGQRARRSRPPLDEAAVRSQVQQLRTPVRALQGDYRTLLELRERLKRAHAWPVGARLSHLAAVTTRMVLPSPTAAAGAPESPWLQWLRGDVGASSFAEGLGTELQDVLLPLLLQLVEDARGGRDPCAVQLARQLRTLGVQADWPSLDEPLARSQGPPGHDVVGSVESAFA